MKKWNGTVAFLDRPTVDGRMIPEKNFGWRPLPIPLRSVLYVEYQVGIVGAVESISFVDGIVIASGTVEDDFPSGKFGVGIDLDPATNQVMAVTINDNPAFPGAQITIEEQ